MDRIYNLAKTAEFKGFCYGFVACLLVIFSVAAGTQNAITFTASDAITLTPFHRAPFCPCCPVVKPLVCPDPVVVPAQPKKKKGDVGDVSMSMLD